MKKHSFLCELLIFCVIFLFLVLPSILSQFVSNTEISLGFSQFPVIQFFYCLCGILVFIFYSEKNKKLHSGAEFLLKVLFPSFIFFPLLFCVSLFITFIAKILPQNILSYFVSDFEVTKPVLFWDYFYCVLNFLFAAIYEELIFRFYLTDALLSLIQRKSEKKFWYYFCEIIVAFVFAIGHYYLGLLSVLNALIAHIILRKCYKKCGNIYTGILSHFIYNLLVFILL